jgi:hypothetical protein
MVAEGVGSGVEGGMLTLWVLLLMFLGVLTASALFSVNDRLPNKERRFAAGVVLLLVFTIAFMAR